MRTLPPARRPLRLAIAIAVLALPALPVGAQAAAGAGPPGGASAAGGVAAPGATVTSSTTTLGATRTTVAPNGATRTTTVTATGTTPTVPAGTPASPAAPNTTAITPANQPAQAAKSSGKVSNGALLVAIVAGLVALACLIWGVFRFGAFEPHWLLSLRHSLAEAGFRASATWAEFGDWIRLGR